MKTILTVFTLFLSASISFSQGLDIYIDAATGKNIFVCGKDTLAKPAVKRGETINLYLLNYNNYLYDIEIEESLRQTSYFSTAIDTSQFSAMAPSSAGNTTFDLMSIIMNPAGLMGMNPLAQGQLSMLGNLFTPSKGFADEEEEEDLMIQELKTLEYQYEKVLEDLAQTENNLLAIQQDAERLVNAKAIQAMATEEIRKLQFNPNLTVSQIKKLSDEYLRLVFANTPADQIDMDFLWKIYQKGQEINLHLKNIDTERENYSSGLADIQQLALNLSSMKESIKSPKAMGAYEQIEQSLRESLEKGEKEKTRLNSTYESLSQAVAQPSPEEFQKLIELRYTFEELRSNNFTYQYQTTAREDMTELTVRLNPKENLPAGIKVNSRKLASVQIPARGGLKVNGSVGLGFGQFFTRPQSYFVREDSIIRAQDDDSFVPYLASFIHFYAYRPAQVSFGGSFGVGIPVFNTQGQQSIAFFLGPSLYMGGAQRITLTGGIMGAKVQTLSQGYAVGDVLDVPALGVPTMGRYKLGYFIGVSINFLSN